MRIGNAFTSEAKGKISVLSRADDGYFSINGVNEVEQYLYVTHPDYAPAMLTIEVGEEEPKPVTAHLSQGGRITGLVVRNGAPVPDVTVALIGNFMPGAVGWTPTFGISLNTKTDAKGAFEFTRLMPAVYQLTPIPWQVPSTYRIFEVYEPRLTAEIEVKDGETVTHSLRIP